MKTVVFLVSGGGGTLSFLQCAFDHYLSQKFKIVGVLADRPCAAEAWARHQGIPSHIINYERAYPEKFNRLLLSMQPDYVITNIHKILNLEGLTALKGRLVNLHYSLLPLFKGHIGSRPVELALEAGCKFVGTTVHHVSAEVDAGQIITQSVIPMNEDQPFAELMDRVFRSGCINLFRALCILEGLHTKGGHLDPTYSPPLHLDKDWFSNEFWLTWRNLHETK